MPTRIPQDLIEKLRERRVIPFIGAGFSASLGMPTWDDMLRTIAAEMQGIPSYDEIRRCCQGDNLQIAEYFYLKYDKSIGPIRLRLSHLLQPKSSLVSSAAHVELVNLNAPQIYTTNYDEAIEQTFKALGQAHDLVALPKHIAQANRSKSQVIKYHGDLRYDSTLVLTESSYYSRLEFESPMDLKFRSDLLGRSVLFIGYSFRDINIRIIWFKLMEMMRDVPPADRPSSFVVRFEKNEVLEDLYKEVGIRTIYLDPDNKAKSAEDRSKLLQLFMMELSVATSDDGRMPGTDAPMYMSAGLLNAVKEELKRAPNRIPFSRNSGDSPLLRHAAARKIPPELAQSVDDALKQAARYYSPLIADWVINFFSEGYVGQGSAVAIMLLLLRASTRKKLLGSDKIPWSYVWGAEIGADVAEILCATLDDEINGHSSGLIDDDLAYAAALVKQVESGPKSPNPELVAKASELLKRAARVYPSVRRLGVSTEAPPAVGILLAEIGDAISKRQSDRDQGEEFDQDIPF